MKNMINIGKELLEEDFNKHRELTEPGLNFTLKQLVHVDLY